MVPRCSRGYEQAAHGDDGFVCLVERSWASPFDSPGFWNPEIRGPDCSNPAAVRSVLSGIYMRTRLALAGLSKEQILDSVRAAFAAHQLDSPEPGAMSYMMSKMQRVGPAAGRWLPPLMFELPRAAPIGAQGRSHGVRGLRNLRSRTDPREAGKRSAPQMGRGAFMDRREARAGIEPAYSGFADRRLTTWLPRRGSENLVRPPRPLKLALAVAPLCSAPARP